MATIPLRMASGRKSHASTTFRRSGERAEGLPSSLPTGTETVDFSGESVPLGYVRVLPAEFFHHSRRRLQKHTCSRAVVRLRNRSCHFAAFTQPPPCRVLSISIRTIGSDAPLTIRHVF